MITVVGMIYKSTKYLDFMMEGIRDTCADYLIVANDPVPAVVEKLKLDGIKHVIYNDSQPDDYYLNRVYRAWNFGGRMAKGDVIVFVNSDMAFGPDWLDNLLFRLDENTIPCSRLVESGKLFSGQPHTISRNYGTTVEDFDKPGFLTFATEVSSDVVALGGTYMPCAFYKDDFIRSGGYPEGNIYTGGVGKHTTKFVRSGDKHFFCENSVMKMKRHVTVFSSVVYHIQEGEMDA